MFDYITFIIFFILVAVAVVRQINRVKPEEAPLNTHKFNNEFTEQVDWTPLKKGGTNFATKKLVQVSSMRYEFKPSIGMYAFVGTFILLPILVGGVFIHLEQQLGNMSTLSGGISQVEHTSESADILNLMTYLPWVVVCIFILFGIAYFVWSSKPIVFDKNDQLFWIKSRPTIMHDDGNERTWARFDEIKGLQIIKEEIRGKNSFYSYELNVVLKNTKRINVVDHGNLAKIQEEAQKLSEFLGVPVWDMAK
jgi:preprotein translocase subunit SecG